MQGVNIDESSPCLFWGIIIDILTKQTVIKPLPACASTFSFIYLVGNLHDSHKVVL